MWLADVDSVWDDPLPVDGLRETELALQLLERTRELLGDGEYWRAEALAMTAESEPCDPLSDKALTSAWAAPQPARAGRCAKSSLTPRSARPTSAR
jgi:hypothetical protein